MGIKDLKNRVPITLTFDNDLIDNVRKKTQRLGIPLSRHLDRLIVEDNEKRLRNEKTAWDLILNEFGEKKNGQLKKQVIEPEKLCSPSLSIDSSLIDDLKATGKKTKISISLYAATLFQLYLQEEAQKVMPGHFQPKHTVMEPRCMERANILYDSGELANIEVGTIEGLCRIHKLLFEGIYDSAGAIRNENIPKGHVCFVSARYLTDVLLNIEKMPEDTFEKIIAKYVEITIAHPFMDGNGRSGGIWLDMMLNKNLKKSVDWSRVGSYPYLHAMEKCSEDSSKLITLLRKSTTSLMTDRETFITCIERTYFYETNSVVLF